MSAIHPFPGLRFDTTRMGQDLVGLVCPPEFLVGPAKKRALFLRHPWNWIRIETGQEEWDATSTGQGEDRSKDILRKWVAEGILARDTPSFYSCSEKFTATVGGLDDRFDRHGLFARVDASELESTGQSDCLREVPPPCMVLHEVPFETLRALGLWEGQPICQFLDDESVERTVRRIQDPMVHASLQAAFAKSRMVPLDPTAPAAGPVMVYLVSVDDPGLVLPPLHRIYRELEMPWETFCQRLMEVFETETLPYLGADGAESLLASVRDTHHGFVFRQTGSSEILFARKERGNFSRGGLNALSLDAEVLEEVVERSVLGLPEPAQRRQASIAETTEGHLAMDFLESDPHSSLAVLANPPSARAWFEWASSGHTSRVRPIPHPAVCSGLVALEP